MTDQELMEMALEALESCGEDRTSDGEAYEYYDYRRVDYAKKILRERLAQPETEPVAWMEDSRGNKYEIPEANKGYLLKAMENGVMPDDLIEAYERGFSDGKAKREWVWLTDVEIADIEDEELTLINTETFSFAKAIEAKLKEKNGG